MTRSTNARIAGLTFLLYIATGILAMVLFQPVASATGAAARLASVAEHVGRVRLSVVLSLFTVFHAFVLAVTLYAITRDEDPDLALLGLVCRVAEGVVGVIGLVGTLGLLWLARGGGATAPDDVSAATLVGLFMRTHAWAFALGGTMFAVGSTAFTWLFLRARTIPVWLAQLGLFASILLVVILPAQLVGLVSSPVSDVIWLPMLVFEVVLGFRLMLRGVDAPIGRTAVSAAV